MQAVETGERKREGIIWGKKKKAVGVLIRADSEVLVWCLFNISWGK